MFWDLVKMILGITSVAVGIISLAIALDESAHDNWWMAFKFLFMGIVVLCFGIYLTKTVIDKFDQTIDTIQINAYCLVVNGKIDYSRCIAREIIEGQR